jgi:hypothetical protein
MRSRRLRDAGIGVPCRARGAKAGRGAGFRRRGDGGASEARRQAEARSVRAVLGASAPAARSLELQLEELEATATEDTCAAELATEAAAVRKAGRDDNANCDRIVCPVMTAKVRSKARTWSPIVIQRLSMTRTREDLSSSPRLGSETSNIIVSDVTRCLRTLRVRQTAS